MENLDEQMFNALIIDDEIDVCYLLSGILKNRNISSRYVNCLSEAKSILKRFSPPFIFLDNHLPDGWGVDFIGYIKENCPHSSIVIITANESVIKNRVFFKKDVLEFIQKPFTIESINTTIDKMISLEWADPTVESQDNIDFF